MIDFFCHRRSPKTPREKIVPATSASGRSDQISSKATKAATKAAAYLPRITLGKQCIGKPSPAIIDCDDAPLFNFYDEGIII